MRPTTLLIAAAACVSAVPAAQRATGPSVTIADGTVVGSSSFGIDTFAGIPFAEPPVGPLRLKAPQSLKNPFGTLHATGTPKSCPQFLSTVDTSTLPGKVTALVDELPILGTNATSSEDCLNLNVYRPSNANATSKLPVAVWIFGGGFELGSQSTYDGSGVVRTSMQMGKPVLYVAMNYRVAGFGFLAGKELSQEGSTNLGLRDQRIALQWVADNIAAFGGDPDKVTIWGESAGAISVTDQTVINGGDHTYKGKPLFHGAIANSGSIVPARTTSSGKAQAVYDTVVKAAGCDGQADTLACLRALPFEKFNLATQSVPGIFSYQSLDLSYVPRPDPHDSFFAESPDASLQAGRFARVPVINGDQEDEGCLFSLSQNNVTDNEKVITYFNDFFPGVPRENVADLVNAYPDDPAAGSPFGTGILNEIYPEYKRIAAILGDITFTLTRRAYVANISSLVDTYSYLDTFLYGTPVLGTFHGSDAVNTYFLPLSERVKAQTLAYYISFFNYQNPNTMRAAGAPEWPKWDINTRQILNFGTFNTTYMTDDFRSNQFDALIRQSGVLKI